MSCCFLFGGAGAWELFPCCSAALGKGRGGGEVGADHCNEAGWQKFCCGGGGGGDTKDSAAGGWGGGGARGWLAEILLHGRGWGGDSKNSAAGGWGGGGARGWLAEILLHGGAWGGADHCYEARWQKFCCMGRGAGGWVGLGLVKDSSGPPRPWTSPFPARHYWSGGCSVVRSQGLPD